MRALSGGVFFVIFGLGLLGLVVWLWGFGGQADIARWAAAEQREVQGALAGALRAVRAGQPAAVWSLWALCFAYGFFHAAGPGHGKLVMGGYALGEDVRKRRLVGLSLAGSLGQAVTAVLLVGFGAAIFGWGRTQMTDLADGTLALFSAVAIGLVGLWLVLRGVRRWRASVASHRHDHDHRQHGDGEVCASCGHAHGPTQAQLREATTWRSALGVVLAIAVRPCTGALFVLILTFGMGIAWVGIVGALVMGFGTAILTIMVALGAGVLRSGLAERLQGTGGVRAMAIVEVAAGLLVAVLAAQVALRLWAL